MSTAEIVVVALGAWCCVSALVGLLVGRVLRLSHRHPRPTVPPQGHPEEAREGPSDREGPPSAPS